MFLGQSFREQKEVPSMNRENKPKTETMKKLEIKPSVKAIKSAYKKTKLVVEGQTSDQT